MPLTDHPPRAMRTLLATHPRYYLVSGLSRSPNPAGPTFSCHHPAAATCTIPLHMVLVVDMLLAGHVDEQYSRATVPVFSHRSSECGTVASVIGVDLHIDDLLALPFVILDLIDAAVLHPRVRSVRRLHQIVQLRIREFRGCGYFDLRMRRVKWFRPQPPHAHRNRGYYDHRDDCPCQPLPRMCTMRFHVPPTPISIIYYHAR